MPVDSDHIGVRPEARGAWSAPVVSPRVACSLALLTGVLYFLAFTGTGPWALSLVAYVPLIVAHDGRSAKCAWALGATSGLMMSLLGFHWLYGTLTRFTSLPAPICGAAVLFLCAYQAGRVALFSWLQGRARERGWWASPVVLLAFVASEVAYPLLFPWYFAACVHQVPALMQAAELGGPCAVGLVLMATNLAIARVILSWLRRQPVRLRFVVLALLTPSMAGYAGLLRMQQIDAHVRGSEPVHIGLVQGNMPLNQTGRDRVKGIRNHLRMSEELRARGAELVVWSETTLKNVPGHDYSGYLERLFAGRLQVPTIFGALLVDSSGSAFNSALASDANGRIVSRYDKQRLLPFAEVAPLGETFPALYQWLPNASHYSSGASSDPLQVGHHLVTALICYEDLFPGLVNDAVRHGASEMIVNLTNDGWFGDTIEPQIHLALAKLRAIEHRRYLVRATNSGVSAIVDPVGRVVVSGNVFREEALDAHARWIHTPDTGYEIWGDVPWWIATVSSVLAAFVRRRQSVSPYPLPDGECPSTTDTPGKQSCEGLVPSAASTGKTDPGLRIASKGGQHVSSPG